MTSSSVLEFVPAFTERRQCFAELLAFSRAQLALIDSDDYTRLLSLLGSKQRVIGRLEEIGKLHPRLWDAWRTARTQLPPVERATCERLLAETEALLAELLEHERVGTEQLARRRDHTQLELQDVTTGSQAQSAYRDSLAPATHRHLDIDQ